MAEVINYRFRVRRGLAADWTTKNEVLLQGEFGLETDTTKLKIGDGSTPWNSLPYLNESASEPFAVAGGTANALTASFTPVVTALTDGEQIKVRAAAANTSTAPTLAVDALTARTIAKNGNKPLAAGDIKGAGHELLLRYVAATTPRFELLNPASSSGGVSSIVAGAGITIDDTIPEAPVIHNDGVRGLSAGVGIGIDNTDPVHPVIHNDGVRGLVAGTGIDIDATDPHAPEIINTRAGLDPDGVAATYAALPTPPGEGTGAVYYVQADGLFYIYDGSTWPAEGDGLDVRGGGGMSFITGGELF